MILLTGVAGFIGFHVARRLLGDGHYVVGVDELNDYYDPKVKHARLRELEPFPTFRFVRADISVEGALETALPPENTTFILHLAAQAGVRHSLIAPFSYERSNVKGHLAVLEYARRVPRLQHMVYASSSSVYGDRSHGPFHETDRCDAPASLYAATKRACELMSDTYARLWNLPLTGLRFFTVYGPWGRPDMALWLFTDAIEKGEPITLFGAGDLARDYTCIDDIVPTVCTALLERPPTSPAHAIYNLGNSNPASTNVLVAAIEAATGKRALVRHAPRSPVEVAATFADISRAAEALSFAPSVPLEEGVRRFVRWRTSYPEF